MKKTLSLITLFILTATCTFADETRQVTLDADNPRQQLDLRFANLFVACESPDAEGNARVSIEVENKGDSYAIIIFGRAFPEKELKKNSPSIVFDKSFSGSRTIETYDGVSSVLIIELQEKKSLSDIQLTADDAGSCSIPFYIARYKRYVGPENKKNKYAVTDKELIRLDILLDTGPDTDYARVEQAYDQLLEELREKPICTNGRHRPSTREQENSYEKKIRSLTSEIDSIVTQHNWRPKDKRTQQYMALKQKFSDIDLSRHKGDCGKHKIPAPIERCKFCGLSAEKVYEKMEGYYEQLHQRKTTKEVVMPDVQLLYGCKKHSRKWKESKYKGGIEDYYSRINKFRL